MPRGQHGKGYNTAKPTPQHNAKIPLDVPLSEDKRNKVPTIEAPGVRWYICTTAPMAELRAAASLREAEVAGEKPFLAYAPCEFYWRRPVRGSLKMPRREYQRPTMRHYLFVGIRGGICDETMAALRMRDHEGRNKHGLVSILGSHMRGALYLNKIGLGWLTDLADAETRGATDITPAAPFERDEEVRIGTGPFLGFVSRVLTVDIRAEEVIVELSLLGSRSEMRLSFDAVHKAA